MFLFRLMKPRTEPAFPHSDTHPVISVKLLIQPNFFILQKPRPCLCSPYLSEHGPWTLPPVDGFMSSAILPDEDAAWRVWVGSIVSVVLATAAVAARLVARYLSAAPFWWDDVTIVLALVSLFRRRQGKDASSPICG